LHELDFEPEGFQWIDCQDAEQSVVSWIRRGRTGAVAVVAANFTPVPRHGYRIGVPVAGRYRERLNTDSAWYGGSDLGNGAGLSTEAVPWMGFADSMCLTLPPLALVVLEPDA
jgi:1,4-alpha-glucan branching enzyme